MTIRLSFTYNRETLNFVVRNKEIYYSDRKWTGWIRCVPQPENFMRMVAMSRNRIPMHIMNIFKMTPEEMKEYELAQTEDELATIVIRDAKSKGCVFIGQSKELTDADNAKGVIV